MFYQLWREKEAERTLKHLKEFEPLTNTREKGLLLLSAFQNSFRLSLVKSDVNIDLERLYLSFLESYFYGQMELRFLFVLSSTRFRLFQRAIMDVLPSHPGHACLIFHFFPPENPVERFK